MNPEYGRQPGGNQPHNTQPTSPQPWGAGPHGQQPPPAYGPPPGFQPPHYAPQPSYPPQPGQGQWQPTPPPGGNAPAGRNKWLIPLLALMGVLVIVGGVIALLRGSDSNSSAGSAAAASEFAQASDPVEALLAATNVTLDSSPMVSRMSVDGTIISVTQVDYAQGISYGEQSGGPTAGATFYLNNDEMLIRFGDELGLPGVDADTWYRLDMGNPLFGMIGQTIAAVSDRDAQRDMVAVYSTVEDMGKSTFEGQELTRLVATVDTEKFIDYSLAMAKEFGGSELGVSDAELRRELRSQTPRTIEYWVDDHGRIVKQVTGDQVVVNSDFGEPLTIPEIPAAQIEDLPFN